MTGSAAVKPNIILAYVTRKDVPAATGRTASDAWQQYLRNRLGGQAGKRADLEVAWLRSLGATGNTLTDLWASYLPTVGTIPHSTSLQEHIRNFFKYA